MGLKFSMQLKNKGIEIIKALWENLIEKDIGSKLSVQNNFFPDVYYYYLP